jgi:hypothetical protein
MKGTLPRFENIQETLAKAQEMISVQISNIENEKKSVVTYF